VEAELGKDFAQLEQLSFATRREKKRPAVHSSFEESAIT
jgi:hypothetical protein